VRLSRSGRAGPGRAGPVLGRAQTGREPASFIGSGPARVYPGASPARAGGNRAARARPGRPGLAFQSGPFGPGRAGPGRHDGLRRLCARVFK
jgi:hypothetical protein